MYKLFLFFLIISKLNIVFSVDDFSSMSNNPSVLRDSLDLSSIYSDPDSVIIDIDSLRENKSEDLSEKNIDEKFKWVIDYKDKEARDYNFSLIKNLKDKITRSRLNLEEPIVIKDTNEALLERLKHAEDKNNIIEAQKAILEILLNKDKTKETRSNKKLLVSLLLNSGSYMVGAGIIIAFNWILNNWGKI